MSGRRTEATGAAFPVGLGFDVVTNQLIVKPIPAWNIGRNYWIGVRGYQTGVRIFAAHERNLELARQLQVFDKLGLSAQQARVL